MMSIGSVVAFLIAQVVLERCFFVMVGVVELVAEVVTEPLEVLWILS